MGELACASPQACGGGATDAGGWLCGAAASDARHRGLVVTRRPAHPDVAVAHPKQEQGHASAPPPHFDEAQAEQALWQEFRDHNASLNNALNEALRIHRGPAWRIFRVCISIEFGVFSLVSSAFVLLLTQFLSCLVHR
jgi:hypothetical protein